MPSRKFGHNSPYDESGMPLGTETADYDNADEVRKNMVKSTYVEPTPLNDPNYQPPQFTAKQVGMGKDGRPILPHGKKGFNTAVVEGVNLPDNDIDTVDIEDPSERRELLVTEAVSKGWEETPELPKTEKQENVDSVKDDIKEDKGDDFLFTLEEETPAKPEEKK